MDKNLETQMVAELEALRARYVQALQDPFTRDLEAWAVDEKARCDRARSLPGAIDPAADIHLKNKSFLMGEIVNGLYYANAYAAAVERIRERYEGRQRDFERAARDKQLQDQALEVAAGAARSAREHDSGAGREPGAGRDADAPAVGGFGL